MTIKELNPLIAEIRANPNDRDARLVYADWLEERGETELAHGVRLIRDMRPEEIVEQCRSNPKETYDFSSSPDDDFRPVCPGDWSAARAWATIVDAESLGRAWLLAWGRKPFAAVKELFFWFEYSWSSGQFFEGASDSDCLPDEITSRIAVTEHDNESQAITAAAIASGEAFVRGDYVCLWPDEADDCFHQPETRIKEAKS